MEERYIRNIPAISGSDCALLREKRVLVVGCGGLGGYLAELMLRLGVGTVRVADGDSFEASNLNRQILSETSNIGQNKAEAAAERAGRIDPCARVEVFACHMNEENVHELISGCDAVLDGLDNSVSRRILAKACSDSGIPYVFGAVDGWTAQAAVSMPGDGLIDSLYPEGVDIKGKSALCFTPALCASVQAALCTKLLLGRRVDSGRLYYFDLLDQEFEALDMAKPEGE